MKYTTITLLATFIAIGSLFSQPPSKDVARERSSSLEKPFSIEDRAAGTHNASNIGLFFENRGKLYPRRLTDGPSGEFPINSGRHYIYRVNPMVAIAADPAKNIPVSVIQGRFTQNEEWEAVAGYHSPNSAKIAFSDNPNSWPVDGWPVKDTDGKPIILSDQDSYAVYSDSTNTVKVMGIQIAQTGYAYGINFAKDLLFFKYEVTNHGPQDLDSVYFALYCDIDVGNVSGGDPEYGDDLFNFLPDDNFLYFYDADGNSDEWGGATGMFGATFLSTPEIDGQEVGISEVHWNQYYDDLDDDSLQFTLLSSNTSYMPANYSLSNYFHPGSNGTQHIDDPGTVSPAGEDLVANISSGPYTLNRGDTLTFYTAFVAGVDEEDLMTNLAAAQTVYDFDFELAKPPATPSLSSVPGDNRVTLFWNDVAEKSLDTFTGEYDFEGYRIYKSLDKGITWDQIDRNINRNVGPEPVPLADFDVVDGIGDDTSIRYSFIDSSITNGFEYWYCITAYDRGSGDIESLESPIGNTLDAINTISVIPRSDAIGRTPVSADNIMHYGNGVSNYQLQVNPVDKNELASNSYDLSFGYSVRKKIGNLSTDVILNITDSTIAGPDQYGLKFLPTGNYLILNETTGDTLTRADGRPYVTDREFPFIPGMKFKFVEPDSGEAPEAGDYIALNFSAVAVANSGDTVLNNRPFELNKEYATTDGVLFSLNTPDIVQNIIEPGTNDLSIQFQATDESSILDTSYIAIVHNSGLDAESEAFISLGFYYKTPTGVAAIDTIDTLYTGGTFQLPGIEGVVEFDIESPPDVNTTYTFSTIKPVPPTLLDRYQFGIESASISKAQIKSSLENIRVVPNPYVVSSLWEPDFGELRQEPIRQIQFINLPSSCTIHIFTVAGDKIKTLGHHSQDGTETWDLRSDGGREIATGVYLYVVKSDNLEYINRFAVIK